MNMENKCEWKAGSIYFCEEMQNKLQYKERDKLAKIIIDNNVSLKCGHCGGRIRKPKTDQNMTCNSDCGMRIKYGVSCENHSCGYLRPVEPAEPESQKYFIGETMRCGDMAEMGRDGILMKIRKPAELGKSYLFINGEKFDINFDATAENVAERITQVSNILAKKDEPAEPEIIICEECFCASPINQKFCGECGNKFQDPANDELKRFIIDTVNEALENGVIQS